MSQSFDAKDFGLIPDMHLDLSLFAADLCSRLSDGEPSEVHFEPGTYEFWPDKAAELPLNMAGLEEHGWKRAVFSVSSGRDLVIDGHGAEFVLHGELMPFSFTDCFNLTIRNFTIRWDRPFCSEGQLMSQGDESVETRMDKCFPVDVRHDQTTFVGESWEQQARQVIAVADMGNGVQFLTPYHQPAWHFFETEEAWLRVNATFTENLPESTRIICSHSPGTVPATFFHKCQGLFIEDMTFHHACGNALLVQFCEDVICYGVKVIPEDKRHFSTPADALAVVGCRGRVLLRNCRFSHVLGHAVSVYGTYLRIEKRLGNRSLLLKTGHSRHRGIEAARPGDVMEFLHNKSLQVYQQMVVQKVKPLNRDFIILDFTGDLPDKMQASDLIENVSAIPYVEIDNCQAEVTLLPAIRVNSRHTIIHHSRFASVPSAVWVHTDARKSYEAGRINILQIENCSVRGHGAALVEVTANTSEIHDTVNRFHGSVIMKENTFRTLQGLVLKGRSIQEIVMEHNVFVAAEDGSVAVDLDNSEGTRFQFNLIPDGTRVRINGKEQLM